MAFLFENLDVYRKSVDFTDKISCLTESFPRGYYYLCDQLNRAALSIPTNIAEGNGRFHKADRANFFRIARGSAFECIPLLDIASRRQLIDEGQKKELRVLVEEIAKMLSGLHRTDKLLTPQRLFLGDIPRPLRPARISWAE
jgi:four helix bundle protein